MQYYANTILILYCAILEEIFISYLNNNCYLLLQKIVFTFYLAINK